MDHANITRVLDVATAPDGRAYLDTELFDGQLITEYCQQHRLTVRERLALFLPVCQAVQHAHHKAVVHRDLKPSNVLVCHIDGQPVPKVIDFGIAKAIGGPASNQDTQTCCGQIVGTLEYMSPSQAALVRPTGTSDPAESSGRAADSIAAPAGRSREHREIAGRSERPGVRQESAASQ